MSNGPRFSLTHAACREYLPELERAKKARDEQLAAVKQESMSRMMKDLELDRAQNPEAAARDRWDPSQEEDEDADEDLDINIIDRSTYSSRIPACCVCTHDHLQVTNAGLDNTSMSPGPSGGMMTVSPGLVQDKKYILAACDTCIRVGHCIVIVRVRGDS